MPRGALPVLALSLAVLPGCGLFWVEADVAAACQRLEDQRFAVPAGVRAALEPLPADVRGPVAMTNAFEFDVSGQLPDAFADSLRTSFRLDSVVVTASETGADLSFLQELHVRLVPPEGSSLEPRQLDATWSAERPRELAWSGEAFDLVPYLRAGLLRYEVTLVGSLPGDAVVVDIDTCAEASARLYYLEAAQEAGLL